MIKSDCFGVLIAQLWYKQEDLIHYYKNLLLFVKFKEMPNLGDNFHLLNSRLSYFLSNIRVDFFSHSLSQWNARKYFQILIFILFCY